MAETTQALPPRRRPLAMPGLICGSTTSFAWRKGEDAYPHV
jgi:hypothetical protein